VKKIEKVKNSEKIVAGALCATFLLTALLGYLETVTSAEVYVFPREIFFLSATVVATVWALMAFADVRKAVRAR